MGKRKSMRTAWKPPPQRTFQAWKEWISTFDPDVRRIQVHVANGMPELAARALADAFIKRNKLLLGNRHTLEDDVDIADALWAVSDKDLDRLRNAGIHGIRELFSTPKSRIRSLFKKEERYKAEHIIANVEAWSMFAQYPLVDMGILAQLNKIMRDRLGGTDGDLPAGESSVGDDQRG